MREVVFTYNAAAGLREIFDELSPSGCFMIIPENCVGLLTKALNDADIISKCTLIPHPEGEENKTIESASRIWNEMLASGANRKSAVINLGGGMTTDLGGFVAACYMRGVEYINIPTTLLGAVDAACGGKTGVNLAGVKNIVGAFRLPYATIISPQFLGSLPHKQILSGWAEMLKHSLLIGPDTFAEYININPFSLDEKKWLPLIEESVNFKLKIVAADPKEAGLRRILNSGHTFGHALEAYFNETNTPLTHGHAVAIGTVTTLVLSNILFDFPSNQLQLFAEKIRELYPSVHFDCSQYPKLLELMHHDKKNPNPGAICFTLLKQPGEPVEAVSVPDNEILTALDITRDLLGI
ncbi:MAG: 3-dehydroquinate synthase [Prevotella sp.]|nr:3-dehydroquinate synthase [Prevotella sp.]MCM1075322.1 3-dehydroquinate synthase [Ruminococcus sp.]